MAEFAQIKAVVIGVSLGGMDALPVVLGPLPGEFPVPIIVVQHMHPTEDSYLVEYLNLRCKLKILESCEGAIPEAGQVYFAPANHHLIIGESGAFQISQGEKVNFARPSIDVLFKSASPFYGQCLAGILLTGANADGAAGMKLIKENGGLTIAQNPETAVAPAMPQSAINSCEVDFILTLEEIPKVLMRLLMASE